MNIKPYFPQGIVTDEAFCNREQERAALKASIERHEHVVLVAPRRYGKTSLIAQVLQENDFVGTSTDLFFVLTQEEVIKNLSVSVAKLIDSFLPKTKLAANKLINSIVGINPRLTFSFLGQRLELNTKQMNERSISELLLTLDQFAKRAKKNCVLVFDEFQQIGELKESHSIEAAIRHAVERSEYVSYIFCGSKRHLLNEMFSDKSRPLYHLCDLMTIDRIDSKAYCQFLNKAARRKWRKHLASEVLEEIITLAENHPYYINALCRRLWHEKTTPTIQDVRQNWDAYVKQQSSWIANDLSQLTLNRRKVIAALATQPTAEPQGQTFSNRAGLTPSNIKKSLVDLERLDMIYRDPQGYYQLLDPAVAYFLRESLIK